MKLAAATLTVSMLLLVASSAAAQKKGAPATAPAHTTSPAPATAPPSAPAARPKSRFWPPSNTRKKGLMLGGSFGVSGCTDDLCIDVGALVFFRFEALYRVRNYVAFGLHFAMPFFHPDPSIGDAPKAFDVILGLEARAILPLGPFDAWTGIALAWMRYEKTRENCSTGSCVNDTSWLDGIGFGWGAGVLYYVSKNIGVGLDFWLYKGYFLGFCFEERLDNRCLPIDDQRGIGFTWSVGAAAVWLLPL